MWAKVTTLQQHTDEAYLAGARFDNGELYKAGDRLAYPFEGEFDSEAVFIDAIFGVTDRFDLGIQIPYFDQVFADATRDKSPSDSGFSDLRTFAKFRLLQRPAILTVKVGTKLPTGDFKNEVGLIPVGEGQWDFDFVGQLGRSFWPLPIYANVDLGYRVRKQNKQILRDPGDEWFINAEMGINLTSSLLAMAKYDMLRGDPSTDFGFLKNQSEIKRITYLSPTLSYALDEQLAIELAVRFSLNGRNFPAGHQIAVGVSSQFNGSALLATLW